MADFKFQISLAAPGTFEIKTKDSQYTYNYEVDWGTGGGFVGPYTTNVTSPSYAGTGPYEVTIRGTFPAMDFSDQVELTNILQWGTSMVWVDFTDAFKNCIGLLNLVVDDNPIIGNSTNVSCEGMFSGCTNFIGSVSNWNTTNVISMKNMFFNASSFDDNIGGWNVSSVTDMEGMFDGASSFNKYIGDWNVGSVITMQKMFGSATSFNQPIGCWNVSNVNNMIEMFSTASAFNQNLNYWDVASFGTAPLFFDHAANVNFVNNAAWKPKWGTIPSTNNILTGKGAPNIPCSENGDFYVDLENGVIYGPKTLGVWGLPTENIYNPNTNDAIFSDATPTGVDGDFYIDTSTNEIFGPNSTGTWPMTGTDLTEFISTRLTGPSSILNGSGAPMDNLGKNGDFYIDTDPMVYEIYGPKGVPTPGSWPATSTSLIGPMGTEGTDGSTVINGIVDPTTEGEDGDFYINTLTNTLFGPKGKVTPGVWPTPGTLLVGPTGASGKDSNGTIAVVGLGIGITAMVLVIPLLIWLIISLLK